MSTARAPGHPVTTAVFILVAVGIVANSFVAYPVQSLIGTAILLTAAGATPSFDRTVQHEDTGTRVYRLGEGACPPRR